MNYAKILVVDDEDHIVELIKFNLESNGYDVVTANDGQEAVFKSKTENPDLIILDLMLPKVDGIEVCRKIKGDPETSHIAIIMLTAKSDEADKIVGLEIGADDYITKPFSVRELIARIKAVLRRNPNNKSGDYTENILKIGDIVIDDEKHEVTKDGKKVDLTLKEFELLRILAKNKGKVLSRNFLLDEVWGYDYFGETRTVDVHIRHIRKKIENDDSRPEYIETIRGIGYKMK
ncbi:alkaline phosphatase synthesis transcriptional regulatory protein PhoP [Gottschalkia acidurici 9a]|uniref:Alkaline phosphatase synthesis transcriptional regulatory protein PhoP n=1 Tax=Gottschalkia acidurici (strain ATCC 7906 / DSM 604 / BCRC 14475 / CIP 104303 / KCTC 5404 / NCIMB 10678 / 9a) TaxID=1128398 RepID=K0B029_GOTA9|nr:response regulator transcription factor [Gottschalkia acidurici]AFS78325.1 alkaline phosphatase synthesis transcriptional regulatory protein PhoP [Gottschalkia acidurici 9a]